MTDFDSFHLEMVDKPVRLELFLLYIDRLGVDGHLPLGLGAEFEWLLGRPVGAEALS